MSGPFAFNPSKVPHPYCMDPKIVILTSGQDRYGKNGVWISVGGEWVRLAETEALRLFKKWRQARQLRKQWEVESKPK